jgi:DnaK suppressor protein
MRTPDIERTKMLQDMLVRLRDEAYERVRELRHDQEQESETEVADEMDLARATADVETHAGLIARAEEKLNFIDEALARLEKGKYGECMGCHGPIPVERLIAVPFARYCIDCQEKRNRTKRGWSAGGTIPPYDSQWTLPEEMAEAGEREHFSTIAKEEEEETRMQRGGVGVEAPEGGTRRKRRGRPKTRR